MRVPRKLKKKLKKQQHIDHLIQFVKERMFNSMVFAQNAKIGLPK